MRNHSANYFTCFTHRQQMIPIRDEGHSLENYALTLAFQLSQAYLIRFHLTPPNPVMAPPRAHTPSRHRARQSTKAGPRPEAETEAESSAPRAKTPHRRRHNQVMETDPEVEIENDEADAARALKARHYRRPSRPTEVDAEANAEAEAEAKADADAEAEAENQLENLAQPTNPTRNPPAPRQWALYFANLVREPFIPSSSPFSSKHGHSLLPTLLPVHSHRNDTLTHI